VNASPAASTDAVLDIVRRYWGFGSLRPLQEEAIAAGLAGRDSLVVLPTGGGKSLCYQVPAALRGRTDVVVSPLISLMKDQVDGLRASGYPAAALYSGQPFDELTRTEREIAAGNHRLVYVAPERLLMPRFLNLIERLEVRAFAVDEAHCISHWGHDFRPEYRQLAELKRRFPAAGVHAFTATATERVRADIIAQLQLDDPLVLVGRFDRANLVYRVVPREDAYRQVIAVLGRHQGQAAIIYCLSRRDTEEMVAALTRAGVRAAFYHAGMEPQARRKVQDAFAAEELNVVAATIAFGMGIDRSDVRAVIHAAMPKSVEHYQQETGRAGRDGLEAECVLLYSGADVLRWEAILDKGAAETGTPPEVSRAARGLLAEMRRYASTMVCRHRALSEYFGQGYEAPSCGACDVCLNEVEGVEDATLTAQKILSCVARVGERFGVTHVADVLAGAQTETVKRLRHDRLSTHGLLKELPRKAVISLVYQLIDAGVLARTEGDRPILQLNPASWEVMRGQRSVQLIRPKQGEVRKTRFDETSWEGVDRGLFEALRALRRDVARERDVPPFVIFSDATLRDLARTRPSTPEGLLRVKGVGERKLADLGDRVLACVAEYCRAQGVARDVAPVEFEISGPTRRVLAKTTAFEMFARGASIEAVAAEVARTRRTVVEYLADFVAETRPETIDAWVAPDVVAAVARAAEELGSERLKPIHERLGGKVSYDDIIVALAHVAPRAPV
jgi:ATP-dependent DNA helicase RecQ